MPSLCMTLVRPTTLGPHILMLLCSLALSAGCGSASNGRYGLSGNVTYQGSALETGAIEFVASDGSQQSGATIQNGAYSIPAAKGLPPGKYTVKITSVESAELTGPPGPESMRPTGKEKIPAEYNTATTQEVDVTADGSNTFDFDIP